MKYIRTKDGIEKLDANREHLAKYMNGKLADTIEELCDEFVAKKDNSKPFVIKRYEIYSNLQFGFTIYGAVWVGADLHSVAKTNDKGEFELL